MNNFIPMLKAAGYTVIQQQVYTGPSEGNNRVPLAYKTSKFTCLESGWKELPGGNSWFGVTWAVLKNKATSEVIAATSTHFYNVGTLEEKLPIRVDNSKMILSVTKDIVNRYGCEVVNMGDYNMRPYDEAYKVMIGDGIVDETRFNSLRDGMIFRSGHAMGSSALIGGSPSRTIDFFFTTSKVNVLRTRIVINLQTSYCSDHWPIYIDFSLKK